MLRTPYGKRDVFNQGYAHPAWYVSRGYAVVCQGVRGRWDSGDEFNPYANESRDGADTIDWIAAQPWCGGAVGMYGFSYGGATQLLAAAETPPALLAAAPGMTGSNYCDGWTYRDGALNHAFILSWAAELAMDQALRAGDEAAAAALADLVSHPAELYARLPVREAIPEALRAYAPYLDDWFDHPVYDDYWKRWSPRENYDRMNFAGLHIAGWYDNFLAPTIENFNALTQRGRAHQMLVVGPWYHMPWAQQVGDVDFGPQGRNLIDEFQVRFFDRWLRGEPNGIEEEAPVRLFVMGTNRWTSARRWPPDGVSTMTLHLSSDGRANSLNGTGCLRPEPAGGEAPPDAYPANPHLPIASLGGRSCCYAHTAPMGPADQRPEEARNDVLVYDGERLDRELVCIGEPNLTLAFACDCPTTDVVARARRCAPRRHRHQRERRHRQARQHQRRRHRRGRHCSFPHRDLLPGRASHSFGGDRQQLPDARQEPERGGRSAEGDLARLSRGDALRLSRCAPRIVSAAADPRWMMGGAIA